MGGKSTTSTQSVQIPPEVMARYRAVNARAEDVAQTPFQAYGGEFVAPLSPTQYQGIYNTSAYSQAAQPYYTGATGLTLAGARDVGSLTPEQIAYYQNPAMTATVAPTLAALQQQQGQQLAQQQAGAIRSGAFGGDRSGIERATLMGQQNLATGQAIAPIYQQAYQTALQTAQGQQGVRAADLTRRMQAGQQLAGIGTQAQQSGLQGAQAQIGAGTLEQQTQQALDTAKYQQFLQERGYPFQVAQFLANIAMGTGALSGSTTTSVTQSDARLKDNIEPIGKTFDDQPIYRYDFGDGRTQIGLMAQDVLARGKPGVVMGDNGYLAVDYHDATDDAAAMASMGGAVDEPGHYERGGYVGGGLVSSDDIKAILAAQQQAFSPFSQAGLYGGQGAGAKAPGGAGFVPSANLPVPKLVTASGAPAQAPSGLSQAMKTGEGIAGAYRTGKELKKDFQDWTKKDDTAKTNVPVSQSGVALPADTSITAASRGVTPFKGVTVEGAPKQVSSLDESLDDAGNFGNFAARGGLILPREHYATQGYVNPYDVTAGEDPIQEAVDSGSRHQYSLAKPGEMPKPKQDSTASDVTRAIGAAKSAKIIADKAMAASKPAAETAGTYTGSLTQGAAGLGPTEAIGASATPAGTFTGSITGAGAGGLPGATAAGADVAGAGVTGSNAGLGVLSTETPLLTGAGSGLAGAGELGAAGAGLGEGLGTAAGIGEGLGAAAGAGEAAAGLGTAAAGVGSTILEALPFLAMLSDARLKDNIEPVGKTFDGQNIYRYDFGDGRTQLGLLAQEVLDHHPDAVGQKDGYLTVDYQRATDDATPFAYGGLVPRQAHADGEEVIADYSPEADLPAVGATETSAQEPDYRAMAIEKAKKYGVDPRAMVKTIEGESSFNPRAVGDEGSSAGLGQFHVAGISQKYPNAGLGDAYFRDRKPELADKLTPQEKIAFLSDPANAEDKLDYMAEHASKKGFGAWTAARKAGLVPSADLPAEGAREAQFRFPGQEEESLPSSILDKLTSERYLVPALSFLGTWMSSRSPHKLQALGEGIVGGVGGYQSMQKQQMEMAKNLIDVVGNRFERQIVGDNLVYRNKLTGAEVPASQMQSTIYNMFKRAGLDPEAYGIGPAGGASVADQPSEAAKTGALTQALPAATTAEAETQKAPAAAPVKPLTEMNETQLRRHIENNPEQFGLVDADDPRKIRAKISALKSRAESYRTKLNDNAAAQEADRQAQVEQARLDGLLEAAAKQQSSVNMKLNEQQAKQAGDYENEILKRDELFKRAENNWKRLGDIYSDFTTGRSTNFKADLASWAEGLGIPLPNLDKKLAAASNYDAAMKITMQEVYDAMARENLVRAPAASAKGLSQTVPGANLTPGAVYEIIGKNLGEMAYVKQRDQAYLEQARGTSPVRFINKYDAQNPYNLKEQVARGLSQIPVSKDTPRETIDSLYRTYGPHGYKPMGAEEAAPAKTEGPSIPQPLQGKEGLVFSPSRNQYRDAQGNIYDATGKQVQ